MDICNCNESEYCLSKYIPKIMEGKLYGQGEVLVIHPFNKGLTPRIQRDGWNKSIRNDKRASKKMGKQLK